MVQSGKLPETVTAAMEAMPGMFRSEKAQDASAIIQMNFSGNEPGAWTIAIAGGACQVDRGSTNNPDLTINSPSEIWLKIVRRELDPASAFVSGQFTCTGDMAILLQMPGWFGYQ